MRAISARGQQGIDSLGWAALAFRFGVRVRGGASAKPVALAVVSDGLLIAAAQLSHDVHEAANFFFAVVAVDQAGQFVAGGWPTA